MEFYNAEMQPDDPNEAWQLLQGYPTKSVEPQGAVAPEPAGQGQPGAGEGLRGARARKDARRPRRHQPKARQFLAELRAYLEDFGWRSDGIYEIADATWREDPTIPLNTIQGYVAPRATTTTRSSRWRAPQRAARSLRRRRAQKLAGDPAKLARFEELMEAAKYNLRVTEDHSFWIDQMGTAAFRRFCLEVGQRLVDKGVLGDSRRTCSSCTRTSCATRSPMARTRKASSRRSAGRPMDERAQDRAAVPPRRADAQQRRSVLRRHRRQDARPAARRAEHRPERHHRRRGLARHRAGHGQGGRARWSKPASCSRATSWCAR